ncbi:MAG: hypothetical protein QOF28_1648, partial [Actinomycetota bacterium]|nr:hypothetical protein [Actinomycetota bacterium]
MEPTETATGTGRGPAEAAPAPSGRHPGRVAVASVAAIVLVAAAIGVVSATGNDGARPPLVLDPAGSTPAKESPVGANDSGAVAGPTPYRYRLGVKAPDLGADSPVARLEAPSADDGRVASMAAALGLHGDVTSTAGGGRQVTDGRTRLTVDPVPGGWAVSYGSDVGLSSPGSVSASGAPPVKEAPPVTEAPVVHLPD